MIYGKEFFFSKESLKHLTHSRPLPFHITVINMHSFQISSSMNGTYGVQKCGGTRVGLCEVIVGSLEMFLEQTPEMEHRGFWEHLSKKQENYQSVGRSTKILNLEENLKKELNEILLKEEIIWM